MNYDFSGWHPVCTGKYVVCSEHGLVIVCPICQVASNLEAVSGKISASESCKVGNKERIVIGKQSPNIDKGAIV